MKTLTLTSEFFQNECAESFCKAILGNWDSKTNGVFSGWAKRKPNNKFFFVDKAFSGLHTPRSITFKLDDSFSVDWACLYYCITIGTFEKMIKDRELDLIYLATLQGVIIEEAGE